MLANNFKKSLLAAKVGLILSTGVTGVAFAEDNQTGVQENVEVIEVRGIRRSLAEAVNTKRFATSVVDAVSAEDIGKFPDSDVGEALGRIPGVAVSRQFGQGQQVSIRGASSQLTLTTLNGQNVASTGWYTEQAIDRSFNYTLLPPELISGIDVYKSSQANIVEGGVGGTVNVKTRKPLDLDSGTVFASVKSVYSSQSEQWDPAYSGLASYKNDDETFGVLAALAVQETDYVRRGNESLAGWNGAVSANYFLQERERTATNVAFQYAPNDELSFDLTYMNLELEANNNNSSFWIFQAGANCLGENPDGVCMLSEATAATPTDNPSWLQAFARRAKMESETVDFGFEFKRDTFEISGRIGRSEATGGTEAQTNYGGLIGSHEDRYGMIDMTGKRIKIQLKENDYRVGHWNEGSPGVAAWAVRNQPNTDEETYAQLDTKFMLDHDIITAVHVGARFTNHKVEEDNFKGLANIQRNADGSPVLSDANDPTSVVADIADIAPAQLYGNGVNEAGFEYITIPGPHLDAMFNHTAQNFSEYVRDRSGYAALEEENFAFYVMADFSGENYRGNFGLRYISTDVNSDYYGSDITVTGITDSGNFYGGNALKSKTLSNKEADYSDILPSFNIAYDLDEDTILRGSIAQVISRPNYQDVFARSSLSGYDNENPNDQQEVTGNPGLEPFKATQLDVSYEYYYGDSNFASATFFYKDIETFVTSSTTPNQSIGINDPACNCDVWNIVNRVNGDGGDVIGLELQLQHAFDNGFGAIVNYTYADSSSEETNFDDRIGRFSDSSDHTVNLVGYYENDDFGARLAYNWRSEFMIRETGFYSSREHMDFGTLDFTGNYQVNDNISLTLEVVNILEEDSYQIGISGSDGLLKEETKHNFPAWSYVGERKIALGANLRF
ncbi:TonB-dependent receptor [Pseudoalteromonas rubra]|uniref:TonB-dependent receptor n=1 Tax=Pseudoalteromonas rubra TaxID=43658 RepID=A0A0U3IFW6_9GAMM|nr:TonB-dependent receptor [Pseudoalteromonas rubra]ALU42300.1 TonB-dependent receptor [Pseudoalteromonas rubra]